MISNAPVLIRFAAALQERLPAGYPVRTVSAEVAETKESNEYLAVIVSGEGKELVAGNATFELPCELTACLNPNDHTEAEMHAWEQELAAALHATQSALLAAPDGDSYVLLAIRRGAVRVGVGEYGYIWTYPFTVVIQF